MTALRGTISLLGPSAGATWRTLRDCQPQKGAYRLESCFLTCPCIAQQNPGIPSLLPPAYPPFSTWLPGGVPTFPAPGFSLALPSPCPPRGLPLPQAQTSLSPDLNTTLVCLTSRQNKKNKNKDPSVGGKPKTSLQNSTSLQDKA